MKIVFAPDWRSGVPYQRLLAEALQRRGLTIDFLSEYRRVLPLARAMKNHPGDLLHADKHGVLMVPKEIAPDISRAAEKVAEREQRIIGHCKSPDFSLEELQRLFES